MSKLGYNIHSEDNDLKNHILAIQAPVHLVLENYGLAHDLAVANPNTQIIYRPYFPQSDAYHKIMRPNEFVAKMRQLWQGEPNIWFHTGNEAGLGTDLQDWEMALRASPSSMKFVVGNPATGTFPDSVEGWKYADKYIRFLVDNKDRFWLGLHEYFGAIPCLTMPNFENRIYDWDGFLRPAWHVNRFRWLIDYCDTFLNGQYPNIVITEFGTDDVRENRPNSPVNAFFERLKVFSAYYNIRGWKSLQDQFAEWFPKQDPQETYYKMCDWAVTHCYSHPAIKGVCLFTWCKPSSEWDQFNVAYAMTFRRLREQENLYANVELYVTSSNPYNMNIRESASVLSKRVGTLTVGTQFYLDPMPIEVGGYEWYRVRTGSVAGYVRGDVLVYNKYFNSTSAYGVNIRKSASINGNIIGVIRTGDKFLLTGDTEGIWIKIQFNNIVGWVSSQVLTYI